jgi:hypothetical protein
LPFHCLVEKQKFPFSDLHSGNEGAAEKILNESSKGSSQRETDKISDEILFLNSKVLQGVTRPYWPFNGILADGSKQSKFSATL